MKMTTFLYILTVFVFWCSCKKGGDDEVHHINCENLLTDTAGTNDDARIYMPTAFTPNNDGRNDIARPVTSNIASIVFTIYDRTNAVAFSTTQLLSGWSPAFTANTSTVYYYKIQAITVANHHIGMCGELNYLTCRPATNPLTDYYFEDQLTANGFTQPTGENLPVCP